MQAQGAVKAAQFHAFDFDVRVRQLVDHSRVLSNLESDHLPGYLAEPQTVFDYASAFSSVPPSTAVFI